MLYLEARLRGGTRHWALSEGAHLMGRDPMCDIVVEDPSVSRKHLRIVLTGDQLELEDLRSSNGLWVDGARVEKVLISPGQWFSTGSVLFSVRRSVTLNSLDIVDSAWSTPPERGSGREPAGAVTPGEERGPAQADERQTPPPGLGGTSSAEMLQTPIPGGRSAPVEDWLPWAKGRPAAPAHESPPGSPARTYRELLRELVVQPSLDGQAGAMLAAVIALAGAKGGVVILREGDEWVLHLSRGDQIPKWEELPPRLCESASLPSAAPTLVRAGAQTFLCAPVRCGNETIGFILLYPAAHGGAPLGLELLIEVVLAQLPALHAELAGAEAAPSASATALASGSDLFPVPVSGFLSVSETGQRLLAEVDRLAASDLPIMLVGESGTGKELLAHRIHRRSPRVGGPFVALNCSALPRDLVEAELFGIHKGVATGVAERTGRFQQASGGTLLLDEVGDLPLPLQPKLLRALESGEVLPIGAPQPVKVDVRVVSASHLDLRQAARENLFRQDLLFRLAGAEVPVPPLRERPEDILPLARHFAREVAAAHRARFLGIDLEAAALLLGYPWPGNVRELRHVIARAVVLSDGPILHEALLPPEIRRKSDRALGDALLSLREDFRTASDAYARLYFTQLLERCGGNHAEAARQAGLGRTTLYARLQELGLRPPREGREEDAKEPG